MVSYFPRYFSMRAIVCYVVTLLLVSAIFLSFAMPFQFMLFGIVAVLIFFTYSQTLTMKWQHFHTKTFIKKLFTTALAIRIVYVIFIYFYYVAMTGLPHMYYPGDELFYEYMGALWYKCGFFETVGLMRQHASFSDRGYCWWLAFENFLLGTTRPLPSRIIKCVIDAFSCVLMYNLAKRCFGESVGRITGVFCMLMPNMWYYCGLTLKETEMVFLTILFVERASSAIQSSKITIRNIFLPGLIILVMFTFRTALGAVLVAALVAAIVLSSGKQMETWKKVVYCTVFGVWMLLTVGTEIIQETQELWEGRSENQTAGYEWRSQTNSFAKYASASVFAPLIFTIPFSTLVAIPGQENQMMLNGGNFIKNILSGFTIFALITTLITGEWRKYVLPIAVTCGYLLVLVFSNFAHSERFHFPVLPFELMFAAYGITMMKNKHKRWYMMWIVGICVANIAWSWIKLAGRGLV